MVTESVVIACALSAGESCAAEAVGAALAEGEPAPGVALGEALGVDAAKTLLASRKIIMTLPICANTTAD